MAKKTKRSSEKPTKLARISLWFFDKYKFATLLWIATLVLGVLSYGVFLKKEGFPSISFPVGIGGGAYFVDDAEKVDSDITKPISELLTASDGVNEVQTTASENGFNIIAFYDSSLSGEEAAQRFRSTIEDSGVLPKEAVFNAVDFDAALYLGEYNILLSVYSKDSQSLVDLEKTADDIAARLNDYGEVEKAETVSLFDSGVNPQTGQTETRQTNFSRLGLREDGEASFYNAVVVGVKGSENFDVLELSDLVNKDIDRIANDPAFNNIGVVSSADFAPSISNQISSLQNNVISGLIAVSIISFLLITWRASVITALFILSVMLATLLIMFVIGFTINTISLFALVLALGLFVDDATIVVEAIDAGNKKSVPKRRVISRAIGKVAAASFAGTMTTVLVFLPLVFVSGILGEFIRILPVTIIIALITSLVMSLTFIPFISRFVLLRQKPAKPSPINRAETAVADWLAGLPLLLRTNRRRGILVTVTMIGISLLFIFGTGIFANRVNFNIFPPSKDSDQLQMQITYNPGTDIQRALAIAGEVDEEVADRLGEDFISLAYFDSSESSATAYISLKSFKERQTTSIQYLDDLKNFSEVYQSAKVRFSQIDPGPPVEEFPFKVQVYAEQPEQSVSVARELVQSLEGATVKRLNSTTAQITGTNIAYTNGVRRSDGKRYVEVQASFDADDTTALVEAAQKYVEDRYPEKNLPDGVELGFNFGQESENQDSFSSLLVVGPLAVLAMFFLLAIQFRSLMQPLLIFSAIPFSFFGVFYGLYITDNPISFFSMIGFFGLIGIAVNNTILLTDYANQERRNGLPYIESISEATKKRFRPLLTTSLTTVAALTPLALSDPFWVPLAVTIIFGLISSTLLVILCFPYYYLVIEGLRNWTKNRWNSLRQRLS